MALSAELIEQLDAIVLSHENTVGYSEQTMPELRDGDETGREAIRIYVDAKHPAEDLSADELLPDEIAGQPVDVVASGRPELQSTGAPPRATERVQVNPKTRIRPLIGGISGGLFDPPKSGTFGYFVKRGSDVCVLTSAHVLVPQSDDAIQPSPIDHGTAEDKVARVVVRVRDGDSGVDAAAAKLNSNATATLTINELGTISGSAIVNTGEVVRKSGKNSGVTTGTVIDPSATTVVDGVLFRHQIKISGGSKPFSVGGDSGSLVLAGDKAVGLIMSGNTSMNMSWANMIANVLSALGATLPTA